MAPGPELALEHPAVLRELGEGGEDGCLARREATGDFGRRERAVGAGIARHDVAEGVSLTIEESPGEARRRCDAERVAQAPRVLGGGPALLSRHADPDGASLALEPAEPRVRGGPGVAVGQRAHARGRLVPREVAEAQQQVVEPLGARGPVSRVEALQRQLQLGEGVPVHELAQLRLAEELAQLRLVHGQRLRAPLGERGVPLVEVVGHVPEEERGREGRRGLGVHGDEADLAPPHAGGDLHQPRQVEHVAQALPVGLEHDREGRVARGDLQEVVGALPLHPQGRPAARPAPREEERPRGRLAEAGGEEARPPQLAHHEVLDLLRLGQEVRGLRRALALGQAQDDPVVAPDRLDLGLSRLPQARLEGGRPRRVDAPAPG